MPANHSTAEVRVSPWIGSKGFTVQYSRCDGATMSQIRDYVATVRSHRGWATRFQAQPTDGTCSLHVFPLREAVTVFFRFPNVYGQ